VDGLLFTPGDAADLRRVLQSLIDSPAQLAALRANVPPVLSFAAHAQQIEAIYNEVLALC
jgi:hypothetical protein